MGKGFKAGRVNLRKKERKGEEEGVVCGYELFMSCATDRVLLDRRWSCDRECVWRAQLSAITTATRHGDCRPDALCVAYPMSPNM